MDSAGGRLAGVIPKPSGEQKAVPGPGGETWLDADVSGVVVLGVGAGLLSLGAFSAGGLRG